MTATCHRTFVLNRNHRSRLDYHPFISNSHQFSPCEDCHTHSDSKGSSPVHHGPVHDRNGRLVRPYRPDRPSRDSSHRGRHRTFASSLHNTWSVNVADGGSLLSGGLLRTCRNFLVRGSTTNATSYAHRDSTSCTSHSSTCYSDCGCSPAAHISARAIPQTSIALFRTYRSFRIEPKLDDSVDPYPTWNPYVHLHWHPSCYLPVATLASAARSKDSCQGCAVTPNC